MSCYQRLIHNKNNNLHNINWKLHLHFHPAALWVACIHNADRATQPHERCCNSLPASQSVSYSSISKLHWGNWSSNRNGGNEIAVMKQTPIRSVKCCAALFICTSINIHTYIWYVLVCMCGCLYLCITHTALLMNVVVLRFFVCFAEWAYAHRKRKPYKWMQTEVNMSAKAKSNTAKPPA